MASAKTRDRKAAREQEALDSEPRIKWHKISVLTAIKFAEVEDKAGEALLLQKMIEANVANRDDFMRMQELKQKHVAQNQVHDKLELFAQYVEYVPRDWFTDDLPDNPDFSDAKTYEELQTKRFNELYRLLLFGQEQQDAVEKN